MSIDDFDGENMNEAELDQMAENMLEGHSTGLIAAYLRRAPDVVRKRRDNMTAEVQKLHEILAEFVK